MAAALMMMMRNIADRGNNLVVAAGGLKVADIRAAFARLGGVVAGD
jgi:hypothetical protein